jgi:hypothetical protein
MGWIVPVVCGVLGVALLLTLTFTFTRRLEKRRAEEVLARFAGQEILGLTSNALFFGQQSRGPGQVRGNGVLLLTRSQLFFQMWAPRREYTIPLDAIRAVSTPKSHLGKTRFRPLLKVEYTNSAGDSDSCAWLLGNLETWSAALQKVVALRDSAAEEGRG